jgi:signal transduction histidine kinase
LERIVTERTAKLRETVGELEAYSYSIAHDMRAPLRAMQGFSDILIEEYSKKLEANGQRYLHRIAMSAGRMDRLIEDVLNYSKFLRAELPLTPIAVEKLLQGMLETYPIFFPSEADIHVQDPMPKILGNEAALTQVFSNLLDNGIKFVTPGLKPVIRVWAKEINASSTSSGTADEGNRSDGGSYVRFFVQDNGIGIAPDQHEKIFAIFQRINKSTVGTGIGLAIVKKATERMGGRVGVQSAPGKGSTFWIELRKP